MVRTACYGPVDVIVAAVKSVALIGKCCRLIVSANALRIEAVNERELLPTTVRTGTGSGLFT